MPLSATTPGYCYCTARRRYQAVELSLRKTGYELILTPVSKTPGGTWHIRGYHLTADEALTRIERGQHYLHSTNPQIHPSIPPDDPVAARLLEVAALRSRLDSYPDDLDADD